MRIEGVGGYHGNEEESNVCVEGGEVRVWCIVFWLVAEFVCSGRYCVRSVVVPVRGSGMCV